MKRLILNLIIVSATTLSACAHAPRGVSETCLPVPGQNLFSCYGAETPRDLKAEEMKGFACFPAAEISACFQRKK